MFCQNCGAEISEKAAICVKCGVLTSSQGILRQRTSGYAIASMILGVVTFLGGIYIIVPPILAVVFGHKARSEMRNDPKSVKGGGMAFTGLLLGYFGLLIYLGLLMAMAIPAMHKINN